jgi:hypothetical protein
LIFSLVNPWCWELEQYRYLTCIWINEWITLRSEYPQQKNHSVWPWGTNKMIMPTLWRDGLCWALANYLMFFLASDLGMGWIKTALANSTYEQSSNSFWETKLFSLSLSFHFSLYLFFPTAYPGGSDHLETMTPKPTHEARHNWENRREMEIVGTYLDGLPLIWDLENPYSLSHRNLFFVTSAKASHLLKFLPDSWIKIYMWS